MQQERIHSEPPAQPGWRAVLLPLIIIALGTALAFVSTLLGGAVILVGYIWLTTISLPAALALYIVFSPFPIGLTLHHHHVDVSDLMAVVMAVRLLVSAWRDTHRSVVKSVWKRFMGSPFWRPTALLLVLSILSLAVALSHTTTLIKILEYIEFFVVIVAVARQADLDESQWKPVIGAMFGVAGVLALYGLYQFLFHIGPAANVVDHYHIRADAVFGQPNAFGGFEATVFPLVLALIAFGPKWARSWWAWATLSVVALAVIASYSRGAWVAAVAAVFFMGVVAWVARGRTMINRRFVIPGIVIPIVAFVVIDLLGKTNLSHSAPLLLSNTTSSDVTSTVTSVFNPSSNFDTRQRLRIWEQAIQAIKHRPILGVGLGGFHRWMVLHPEPGLKPAPMAHNLYLEWGADLGILGIVTALWIEWSWVRHAVQALVRRARELTAFEFALGLGAFGTIVSFIVHDWVDLLIDHGVVVPLLLALAIVWSLWHRKESERRG